MNTCDLLVLRHMFWKRGNELIIHVGKTFYECWSH